MRSNRIWRFVVSVLLLLILSACGSSKQVVIDYGDAESFEAALNAGENLEGKTVQFIAGEIHPDSALGYNVWAGEHLNFISSRNPDIKTGDLVVVRANTIESQMGSYIISYEKINNAVIGDTTIISSDNLGINGASETEEIGLPEAETIDSSEIDTSIKGEEESKEETSSETENVINLPFDYKFIDVGDYYVPIPDYYKAKTEKEDEWTYFVEEANTHVEAYMYISYVEYGPADDTADLDDPEIKKYYDDSMLEYAKNIRLEAVDNPAITDEYDLTIDDLPAIAFEYLYNLSGDEMQAKSVIAFDVFTGKFIYLDFMEYADAKKDYRADFEEMLKNTYKNGVKHNIDAASNDKGASDDKVTADFKQTMDSYEKFFDQYIQFMEDYKSSDDILSMTSDYMEMLEQYTTTMKEMEDIDTSKLSEADQLYYIEVTNRITEKLLKAGV